MASFSPFVDTRFRLRTSGTGQIPVMLTRVNELRVNANEIALAQQGKECFSLEFVSRSSKRLTQGVYQLRNDSLGAFSLLLVPVGDSGQGEVYEAIVNRLYS